VPPEVLPLLQPYIALVERMGSFQAQLLDGGIEQITVEYCGDVGNLKVAPLTVAVLKGLLAPILEVAVNAVNAPILAKDRGIEVKESKGSDAGNFTSLIRIHVKTSKTGHELAGTLYHKKEPRIVESNNYPVEVIPEGHMLLIYNVDRPGVIGTVGKILGDHQVNIARMQCSRHQQGGNALLIIGLDGPPTTDVMEAIKRESDILSVRHVDLSRGF
ncbi:MAG: ACT domain-containing protein, partial [Nitrospirota bacterium]|nr:ACT domain-containing protein [Nitrospirota bacterium]